MLLQVAFDEFGLKKIEHTLMEIYQYVDILEVGTPLLLFEGVKAIKYFKKKFPNKTILADTKIVDAGDIEADLALKYGADIITVLGNSNIKTIHGAKYVAEKYNKMIMVDLIEMPNIEDNINKFNLLKNHIVMIHTGYDDKITNPKDWFNNVENNIIRFRKIPNVKIAVGGGITENNIINFKYMSPDIITIGRSIMNNKNPLAITKYFENIIKK